VHVWVSISRDSCEESCQKTTKSDRASKAPGATLPVDGIFDANQLMNNASKPPTYQIHGTYCMFDTCHQRSLPHLPGAHEDGSQLEISSLADADLRPALEKTPTTAGLARLCSLQVCFLSASLHTCFCTFPPRVDLGMQAQISTGIIPTHAERFEGKPFLRPRD
jgi:hypothetical protein